MAGVVLDARSEDRPYDDREAFSQRIRPHELIVPDDITLPEVDRGTPLTKWAWATVPVAVSKTAVRFDLADLSIPIPADGAAPRFEPLSHAVLWANERFQERAAETGDVYLSFTAALVVDRDVPYRVLEGVVLAIERGYANLRFVGRHANQLVAWSPPNVAYWTPRFRVAMTDDGFVVPDERIGKVHGDWDFAALTDAANRWRAASPRNVSETAALITAAPDVRYRDLLRAEAALRREGTFPDAHWSPRRPDVDAFGLARLRGDPPDDNAPQ